MSLSINRCIVSKARQNGQYIYRFPRSLKECVCMCEREREEWVPLDLWSIRRAPPPPPPLWFVMPLNSSNSGIRARSFARRSRVSSRMIDGVPGGQCSQPYHVGAHSIHNLHSYTFVSTPTPPRISMGQEIFLLF